MDERRKLMAGARLRKLRSDLGLSQSAMAEELGISVSYINLVERNQRPLTAQLLIRLAEVYSISLNDFSGSEETSTLTAVEEILADPVLQGLRVPRTELRTAVETVPSLVAALRRLHGAYAALIEDGASLAKGDSEDPPRPSEAVEEVRAFLEQSLNHFAQIDAAAESLGTVLRGDRFGDVFAELAGRLQSLHGIRVAVLPREDMGITLRHYDRHRRRLMLSDHLEPQGRMFQAAVQLAVLELGQQIETVIAASGLAQAAHRLAEVVLVNYAAAAILMPYSAFLKAAQELRYDVERLSIRFGAGFEQVAHRLTTLSRPQERGVPFFMIRIDDAGNVSKRFSAGTFPFSRLGGTCPRWNLHSAFRQPGQILTQVVELQDGKKWLTMARTVRRVAPIWGEPEAGYAIGLGCELRFAGQMVYGQGAKEAVPVGIGVTCRLCDRPNCTSRAALPATRQLDISTMTRNLSAFGI